VTPTTLAVIMPSGMSTTPNRTQPAGEPPRDPLTLQVSELFLSIQGEGIRAGAVSAFVRLAGCDLRCIWCDTPYAHEPHRGRPLSIADILTQLDPLPTDEVVVTGGEPLIQPNLQPLLAALARAGKRVTLETNATQFRPLQCDLVSMSLKLASSVPHTGPYAHWAATHERTRLNLPAVCRFLETNNCQLKFVVADEADIAETQSILAQLPPIDPCRVLLMPQARTKHEYRQRAPWLAEQCVRLGLRFGPRLHVELWGARRGR